MIESRLRGGASARLWEPAELPRLIGPTVAAHVAQADRPEAHEGSDLAIEVAVPHGGVISYGLLGAAFRGKPGESLEVSVLSGDDHEFGNALVGIPDKPLVGLPPEYAPSVIDGFLVGKDTIGGVPSGSLAFDRAVHGVVGSSRVIFRSLAACVTRLIFGDPTPWHVVVEEELRL